MGKLLTQGTCKEQTTLKKVCSWKNCSQWSFPMLEQGRLRNRTTGIPYAQHNWKHWALSGTNHNTWDSRKHYAYCLNFLCCLLAHWVNSDSVYVTVKIKQTETRGAEERKKSTLMCLSNCLHTFSFPSTWISNKIFRLVGSKLIQVKFPNFRLVLFATSVYWQSFLPCEIIIE